VTKIPTAASRVAGQARPAAVAVAAALGFAVLVAVPTDLIDTPLFSRAIPPAWWAWPALAASSVLGGLLVATYVAPAGLPRTVGEDRSEDAERRTGLVAGVLTFFAVGCPVCNKLVLVALGSAGAVTWFQPFQPLLQVLALALMAWALVRRVRNRTACPVPVRDNEETPR
jgi:hypothetical protein